MSLSSRTILVIDDEADQRAMIGGVLRRETYRVLEASDYDDALALQAKHRGEIDLLLIDVSLPGGIGFDLAKFLVAIEPQLKVLFVSGHAGAELCKFFDMPLDDRRFLGKPFEPVALLLRVKSILESGDPRAGSASAS